MLSFRALVAGLLLLGSSFAHAQANYQTAANLAATITDDGYNGTLGSMRCVNVVVTGGIVVVGMKAQASVDHTWIGDLVFKLVSPDNTVVTLMSRPGVVEVADDGTAVGGTSANLSSSFPVQFADGAAKSAEAMGNTLSNAQVVCRDDATCVYDPNVGAASPGKLSAFNGKTATGTWKFCAGDGGLGDTGAIQQVLLSFNAGVLGITQAVNDFGAVAVGSTSAERFVTLVNNGNAALTINTLSLAVPPFARTASGSCGNSLPKTLAIGESCTLSYTFSPTANGGAQQDFQLTTNGGGDLGFSLVGSGVQDAVFADGFE